MKNFKTEISPPWHAVSKTYRSLAISIAAVLAVATVSWSGSASAAIVENGDFSADANLFDTWPGYVTGGSNPLSGGTNPAAIPGWTWNGLQGVGLNGMDTTGRLAVFGPSQQKLSPDRNWAFLQGEGAALSQIIKVTPGVTYTVNFEASGRDEGMAASGSIYVVESGEGVIGGRISRPYNDVNFEADSFTFTPVAQTSVELVIEHAGGPAGSSINFTNISVVP